MHYIFLAVITFIFFLTLNYKGSFKKRYSDFIENLKNKKTRKPVLIEFIGCYLGLIIYEHGQKIFHLSLPMHYLTIFIMLYGSILIHELGHYLVARFYKIPINQFVVGNGLTLFKKDKVHFKLFPLSGFVALGQTDKASKAIQVLLAGVVFEILTLPLIVLILKAMSFSAKDIQYFIFIILSLVVYNILPFSKKNDGYGIYKVLKNKSTLLQSDTPQ